MIRFPAARAVVPVGEIPAAQFGVEPMNRRPPVYTGARSRTGVWRRSILAAVAALVTLALVPVSAHALPEERHYEMVSPIYKGGYGVDAIKAAAVEPGSETSNGVVFTSQGAFGGVQSTKYEFQYLARRGAEGWGTVPLEAPAAIAPEGGTIDFTPDLRYSMVESVLGPNTGTAAIAGSEIGYFRHETGDPLEGWEPAGLLKREQGTGEFQVYVQGGSLDQCHYVLDSSDPNAMPLVEPEHGHEALFELGRGGRECGEGYLHFLGLNNNGRLMSPACGVHLGGDGLSLDTRDSLFHAVSNDGREIFFTDDIRSGECGQGDTGGSTAQVFVRLAGSRTVEVSKPMGLDCGVQVPCPGAEQRAPSFFEGASEDGSRVFFTTAQGLVGSDTDSGNDLYMASLGCPAGVEGCSPEERQVTALVQVSHAAGGEPADVEHVVRIAPDGARVYYVARGVITGSPNGLGQRAVAGAENLYVYDVATGETAFVAGLCSGPGFSGEAEDLACPATPQTVGTGRDDRGLWEDGRAPEAQSTPDGAFLVFATYARLAPDDTDDAKDIYRYDAETGSLQRVSAGEAGADADGNGNEGAMDEASIQGAFVGPGIGPGYREREAGTRAISEDGSRVVFESAEALSEAAINGKVNVYEWYEPAGGGAGRVSLISSGTSSTGDCCAVISASGSDIFFATSAELVGRDTDEAVDVYDARTGPGFSSAPVGREECSGDSCQGALSSPAPVVIAASAGQAPGENLAPPAKPEPKSTSKQRGKSKHKTHKRHKQAKPRRSARARRSSRGAVADGRAR